MLQAVHFGVVVARPSSFVRIAWIQIKKATLNESPVCTHLGSNQGPSDYESDALTV